MAKIIKTTRDQELQFPYTFIDKNDNRGIVVGKESAFIAIDWNSLILSMDLLSQKMRFSPDENRVRFFQYNNSEIPSTHSYIVNIIGDNKSNIPLSFYFDQLSNTLRLSKSTLFVGFEKKFVQYRDSESLYGYDVHDYQHMEGFQFFTESEPILIPDNHVSEKHPEYLFSLINPIKQTVLQRYKDIYVLLPEGLFHPVLKYLNTHKLSCSVELVNEKNRKNGYSEHQGKHAKHLTFLHLTKPNSEIPSYIISYLHSLPNINVFTEEYNNNSNPTKGNVYVEYGYRHPLHLPNIIDYFPEESSILLFADKQNSMIITPKPSFLHIDNITKVNIPNQEITRFTPANEKSHLSIELEIKMVRIPGVNDITEATVISNEAFDQLKTIIYKAPSYIFEKYKICNTDNGVFIVSDGSQIDDIPLGILMKRLKGSDIFIPNGRGFKPHIPINLLSKTLDIQNDYYIFMTQNNRYDIPKQNFKTLGKHLLVGIERKDIQITMLPIEAKTDVETNPLKDYLNRAEESDKDMQNRIRIKKFSFFRKIISFIRNLL